MSIELKKSYIYSIPPSNCKFLMDCPWGIFNSIKLLKFKVMKTTLLFSLMLLLTGSVLLAQNKEVITSVTGGISFGKLREYQEPEYLQMPFVGLDFAFVYTDNLRLNTGAFYNMRGVKKTIPFEKYRFSYVELPLFVSVSIAPDLWFEAGGRASYLMKYEYGTLDGSKSSGVGYTELVKPEMFNFGFVFGAHTKIKDKLSMYIRYDRSLSFSHLTALHSDWRFGLNYQINNLGISKKEGIE